MVRKLHVPVVAAVDLPVRCEELIIGEYGDLLLNPQLVQPELGSVEPFLVGHSSQVRPNYRTALLDAPSSSIALLTYMAFSLLIRVIFSCAQLGLYRFAKILCITAIEVAIAQ